MFEFWKPWLSLLSNIGLPSFFQGKKEAQSDQKRDVSKYSFSNKSKVDIPVFLLTKEIYN
ncbi:hypothetical protein LEP1GSC071_1349 [Leptospira santarosai str. JET]|nr:hypothetical protein LEP1GSC071_1349 [Leptospira santarosai str. JET]EPG83830.1 hypothetical protein LEP1GSC048_3235 [Leptospira santarosai serovar Shermani str. 1342KT]